MSALIKITLPNGITKTTEVTSTSTLKELLTAIGSPTTGIEVYNSGDTPMMDLDKNLTYYNNWYVEKGYIPPLYLRHTHSS